MARRDRSSHCRDASARIRGMLDASSLPWSPTEEKIVKANPKTVSPNPDMERNPKTAIPRREKADPVAAEPIHRATEEEIQRKAYEKYCARRGEPGDAMHDWLEAERELSAPKTVAETIALGLISASRHP